ncbi:phosphatidate cytidylyltransferase [Bermanella sp. 47_1433_sub80_T6]|nr:phosphatidate cytidylyltransferase [Bermanella sp. 47_1433_sub80_T6]
MLKQRILTGLVLAPIMIGGIFYLPMMQFMVFIGVITALGAWEWANLSGIQNKLGRVAYTAVISIVLYGLWYFDLDQNSNLLYVAFAWWLSAFVLVRTHPKFKAIWSGTVPRLLMGLIILLPMWMGFVQIKSYPNSGYLIIFVMFIVWGADVGAYFAGRTFGKHKLAPNVSPGKTWEGVYGGIVTTTLVAFIAGLMLQDTIHMDLTIKQWSLLFAATFVVTAVSVVGDLVESMMKRHRGIKDSSNLLPGHGGVMDRIDSMTAALPVFALALSILGWNLNL